MFVQCLVDWGIQEVYNLPHPLSFRILFLPLQLVFPSNLASLRLLLKHTLPLQTLFSAFETGPWMPVSELVAATASHCNTCLELSSALPRYGTCHSLLWCARLSSLTFSPLSKSNQEAHYLELIPLLQMNNSMCASGGGANGLVAFEATFKFTAQDRDENWVDIVAQVKNASRCRQADDAHKW